MRIDKALNLVVPILRENEPTFYVHSTPISYEVFETYYLVLAKTWSTLASNGLDPRSGPGVAAMVLRDVAVSTLRSPGPPAMDWWEGPDGVGGDRGLIAEMRRLSNAIVPSSNGWGPVPLPTAIDQGTVTQEEAKGLDNLLAFFTVSSRVPSSEDRAKLVRGMAAMYDSQTTYLDCTNYVASLKTSTPVEPTGSTRHRLSPAS